MKEFETYSEFEEWAYENNYNPDKRFDEEEESHKRDVVVTFYMENSVTKLWACVSYVQSYDWGANDVSVTEGLVKKEVVNIEYVTKWVYE